MADVVSEMRAFKRDLDQYIRILGRIWQRAPGDGWLAAATPAELRRTTRLRADLSERYGGLHDPIVEALGHEPIIASAGIVGGDAFHLALADPADYSWLAAAFDLAPQAVGQAIGYHQKRRSTRISRWLSFGYWELKDWASMTLDLIARLFRQS